MTIKHALWVLSLTIATSIVPQAFAAGQTTTHGDHAQHSQTEAEAVQSLPLEGGQSAFAAIAEIVALLKSDPETDWAKVDISALREHLVDMSELTLHASVETNDNGNEIIFLVTGQGRTRDAIQAMVPAHAGVLTGEDIYAVETEIVANGAQMRITFSSPQQHLEVAALGFFGVMATGAHHQQHHWQMATGNTIGGVHGH